MKRTVTYLLALGLMVAFVSSAGAVEKKKAEPAKKATTAAPAKQKKATAAPPAKRQTYDSFVDQNKNGIDDRKEKGRKQQTAKQAPQKVQPKKAAADSTKKKK